MVGFCHATHYIFLEANSLAIMIEEEGQGDPGLLPCVVASRATADNWAFTCLSLSSVEHVLIAEEELFPLKFFRCGWWGAALGACRTPAHVAQFGQEQLLAGAPQLLPSRLSRTVREGFNGDHDVLLALQG
ncbi:hypothetical protein D3H34_07315 [Acidovorax cavernicola]|uniref:Uncharacterized protein n=1 Tax=Acidovorax cavernicola TaxID=1675792 RepID=A0A9X8D7C8_9BURK|nr:hypothetical protein D3H34_07315 [Acidovorax cavernicola]